MDRERPGPGEAAEKFTEAAVSAAGACRFACCCCDSNRRDEREREREIAQHKLGVWKRLAAAARATAAATQGRKTRERVFGSCASFRTSGNPYLATILLSGNFFILVTGRNKRVKKLPKHRKFDAMKISRPVTEEVAMASDVWTATRTASEYKDGPSSLPSGRL